MRFGYLDGQYNVFDYGCGRGDDVRGLIENNITASGWDPYFAKNEKRIEADLVNLGFCDQCYRGYRRTNRSS